MDCDGTPEIIVPVRNVLNVIKGDGTALPGWPVTLKGNAADDGRENPIGSSGPVVGDVNGDGMPDIVLTIDGEVRAYDRRGQLLPRFPKTPDGFSAGAVPAIADLNLDGRNEIVVAGTSSVNRSGGEVSKIWVYDLHGSGQYGAVQWGQLAGGSAHQGYFTPGTYCSP
jgi:hypothetical protein